jgi:hypothetical protein
MLATQIAALVDLDEQKARRRSTRLYHGKTLSAANRGRLVDPTNCESPRRPCRM